MDISVSLKALGLVGVAPLKEAILALPQGAWKQNHKSQEGYNVHRRAEAVVLVFADESAWPDITVTRGSGWGLLAEHAVPLMETIISRHYPPGGTIVRAMAARLLPGEVIKPHRDSQPGFHHAHRIQIPLVTNHRIRFMIDGRPYRLDVGQAYEINNQKTHSVANDGDASGVEFIFDYLPPELIDTSQGEKPVTA